MTTRSTLALMLALPFVAACGSSDVTVAPQNMSAVQALTLIFGPDFVPAGRCNGLSAGAIEWVCGGDTLDFITYDDTPGPTEGDPIHHPLDLPTGHVPVALSVRKSMTGDILGTHPGDSFLAVVSYHESGTGAACISFFADTDSDGDPEPTAVHTVGGMILANEAVSAIAGYGDDWVLHCVSATGQSIVLLRDTTSDGYPDTRVGVFADLEALRQGTTDDDIEYLLERRKIYSLGVEAPGEVRLFFQPFMGDRPTHPGHGHTRVSIRLRDTDADDVSDDAVALGLGVERPLLFVRGPTATLAQVRVAAIPHRELDVLVRPATGPEEVVAIQTTYPLAEPYLDIDLTRVVAVGEKLVLRETDPATAAVRETELEVAALLRVRAFLRFVTSSRRAMGGILHRLVPERGAPRQRPACRPKRASGRRPPRPACRWGLLGTTPPTPARHAHTAHRFARLEARRSSRARALRSASWSGTWAPVPKYISSGVWPRNAECGMCALCCST